MSKTKKNNVGSKSHKSFHDILDIDLLKVVAIAIVVTIVIYGVCFLFINSYIGSLLYKRGFTQYIVVLMASSVAVFSSFKFARVRSEWKKLSKNLIPEHINFENHNSYELANLQKSLSQGKSFVAIRCGRVLAAYINSGNRTTVAEFISDDSSFYTAASASSYVLPRILIWAIPLMGFVGTVVGISSAVNGFSSFLGSAEEIEQIKEGIGFVTTGLAVAFDTTLLALLLSVLIMLPLVAIERLESQLLLAVDIYLNDHLLVKLKDKTQNTVEPVATGSSQKFVEEVTKIKAANTQLLEQIELTTKALENRVTVITQLQQGLNNSPESLGISSQLDKVLERVSDNLAQLEPVLKELNLPRRLVLVEEKNKNSKL
jgi:biopolymer transport protein ExbB/TolQ